MKDKSLYPLAIHLFFRQGDKILLLRRYNTGYEDGNYSVVAGHVEANESVTEAGVRESMEEIGVKVNVSDIKIIGIMHRKSNDERVDFFAYVDHWEGEIKNMEPNKCDELIWSNKLSLPHNTINYIRRALDFSDNSIWYDEFGWN
jgi:8-oxo-dGTP diphosphatase